MIESGHVERMSSGGFSSEIEVSQVDAFDGTAQIIIWCQWFDARNIKELRKFLKKLQHQLEQADLDNSD